MHRKLLLIIILFACLNEIRANESTQYSSEKMVLRTKQRANGKGWYIEPGIGYGIPFISTSRQSPLQEIGDRDVFQRGGQTLSVTPLFGTNGGGYIFDMAFGHMFNKVIGIDATVSIARHPNWLDSRIDRPGYFASQYTQADAFYLCPHVVMKWEGKKKFGITGKVGMVIPFGGIVRSNIIIHDREGSLIQSLAGGPIIPLPVGLIDLRLQAETRTSLIPTIGANTSVSLHYKASDKVTVFAQARVLAYTVLTKETRFKDASMVTRLLGNVVQEIGPLRTTFDNVEDAPAILKTIVYHKEITAENNTGRYGNRVDFEKPLDELAVRYNITTAYFNIGMHYNIDRWSKGRSDKKAAKWSKDS
jgi:hypothetical protein